MFEGTEKPKLVEVSNLQLQRNSISGILCLRLVHTPTESNCSKIIWHGTTTNQINNHKPSPTTWGKCWHFHLRIPVIPASKKIWSPLSTFRPSLLTRRYVGIYCILNVHRSCKYHFQIKGYGLNSFQNYWYDTAIKAFHDVWMRKNVTDLLWGYDEKLFEAGQFFADTPPSDK